MAEETIDSLLVRLGLDTDEKDFKEADAMFRGLTTKALQFGATIGAGLGLKELTFGFANATEKAGRFAKVFSVTPEFVDALGFAFGQTGGQADEAFSSIEKVANLIEDTDWGELPSNAFRVAGFDPMMLQGVESVADAYDRITNAVKDMSPEAARRALSALGFGQTEIDLFTATGANSLKSLLAEGRSFSPLTDQMAEQGIEFNNALGRFTKSIEGVSRGISSETIDGLTESINAMADFLRENNQQILQFFKDALPYLEATAVGIGALVAVQAGKKGLGLLLSPKKYAPVLAAAGLYAIAKDQKVQNLVSDPSMENLMSLTDSVVSKFIPVDQLPPGVIQRRFNEADPGERDELMMSLGFNDVEQFVRELEAANRERRPIENNITVDARGATNPAEVEASAKRGVEAALNEMTENTVKDLRSPIK